MFLFSSDQNTNFLITSCLFGELTCLVITSCVCVCACLWARGNFYTDLSDPCLSFSHFLSEQTNSAVCTDKYFLFDLFHLCQLQYKECGAEKTRPVNFSKTVRAVTSWKWDRFKYFWVSEIRLSDMSWHPWVTWKGWIPLRQVKCAERQECELNCRYSLYNYYYSMIGSIMVLVFHDKNTENTHGVSFWNCGWSLTLSALLIS